MQSGRMVAVWRLHARATVLGWWGDLRNQEDEDRYLG